jgi:HEAT repeat protein
VTRSDQAVDDLVGKYRAVLVEMDSQRIEHGGTPRSWNRLVHRMQAIQLQLGATQAYRDAITALISDENPAVRWSAINALAWAEGVARAELEREVETDSCLRGFEAEVVLREFDAGRLNTGATKTT